MKAYNTRDNILLSFVLNFGVGVRSFLPEGYMNKENERKIIIIMGNKQYQLTYVADLMQVELLHYKNNTKLAQNRLRVNNNIRCSWLFNLSYTFQCLQRTYISWFPHFSHMYLHFFIFRTFYLSFYRMSSALPPPCFLKALPRRPGARTVTWEQASPSSLHYCQHTRPCCKSSNMQWCLWVCIVNSLDSNE